MEAFYTSTTQFYIAGDYSTSFTAGRRVKIDCGVDGIRYASVVSSSYIDPSTYVIIDDADITSNITEILLGIVQPGITGSLPEHFHATTEGDGGYLDYQNQINGLSTDIANSQAYLLAEMAVISGSNAAVYAYVDTASGTLNTKIDTTASGLQDQINTLSGTVANLDPLPDQTGNDGKYLTTNGTVASWATVSGGTGSGPSSPYGTIWVTAGTMVPATTSGATAGTSEYSPYNNNVDYYAFDSTSEEYCDFDIVFTEEWDKGTIKAKFYWSSDTGSTAGDTVEWKLSAGKTADSTGIGAVTGTPQVITDTLLANSGTDLQITNATPAITVGGSPAKGNMIHFKVSRNVDGTDNMTEDAWLFGIFIQFYKDTVGTGW